MRPSYVALGDSISIDLYAGGPGRGGASLLARNRDGDFPAWRGRDLATRLPGLEHRILATDGGTSLSLLEHQVPAVERWGLTPSVVTVTVGGNDVLAEYGQTAAALAVVGQVQRRLRETLERVRSVAAEGAVLVVGTVYDPSDGTADAARAGLPPWPEVVEVVATLNETLREVARVCEARVADIHRRFLGHGVLAGDVARPDPRPAERDLWYCGVIEPNAWGASEVRAAFWEALGYDVAKPDGATTAG